MFVFFNNQARELFGNPKINRGFAPIILSFLLCAGISAQTDTGVRPGAIDAGQPFATLTDGQMSFFKGFATTVFNEVETVSDGLGPRFNLDSCGGCHIAPALGGSSPLTNNPQVARAPIMAPGNIV